jgi:general secretion pathway protein D
MKQMVMKWIWLIACLCLLSEQSILHAQSIADKKAALKTTGSDFDIETEQMLAQTNRETEEVHAQIQYLYGEVIRLYQNQAPMEEYKQLLDQINERKHYLSKIENSWRLIATRGNRVDGYGLWHAPETTLEQLIIDYGAQDYVYLIPPEVGSIKLSVDSNLPIPRSAWSEMLELILTQNGVGIRLLNPYLRQLYLFKQNNSHLKMITNRRCDLEVLPSDTRISFVLSPEPSEVRRAYMFLERFINPNTTVLHILGRDILVVGQIGDIQDLLKLYDFVATNRGDKEYRLIPVHKVKATEMANILGAIFDQTVEGQKVESTGSGENNHSSSYVDANGLKVIVLENQAQALFIVGTKQEIQKAEEIIHRVESQVGGARDKVAFWYTVKHSDAEELADILYRIYHLMIVTGAGSENQKATHEGGAMPDSKIEPPPLPPLSNPDGLYQEGAGFIVNPAPAQPGTIPPTKSNANRQNFIADIKTGSIVMVVEAEILPKMKDLLRKLDVPKKMVQIEALLFEKVLTRENSMGLNFFRIGELATGTNLTGAIFNTIFPSRKDFIATNTGIFDFLFSRKRSDCGIPAFDLAYRFLLSQDDLQIHSSPSILVLNQTPANITINQDISINTGIYEVKTVDGVTLKDAFSRAQYGTNISVKPTIHTNEEDEGDDGYDYVTLETDLTFDTIHPGSNHNRPDVTRRHIKNTIQVPDGESALIGNFRRKISDDGNKSLPFLGELPGIGKLFSMSTAKDNNTEMFIFITPKIVKDPKEQLACIRQELLCRRPGDLPYFLECVEEAHQFEKARLMEQSMFLLLGRPRTRYYCPTECECYPEGEYDGR